MPDDDAGPGPHDDPSSARYDRHGNPPPLSPALAETTWLLTRGVASLLLGQMRTVEERVSDPAVRWETLRTALTTFAGTERPP